MDAIDCRKSESEVGQIAVQENAGGNDTVPISVWRDADARLTECCRSSLFVEFFVWLRLVAL